MASNIATSRRRDWLLTATLAVAILVTSLIRVPEAAPSDPGLVGLTVPFHLVGLTVPFHLVGFTVPFHLVGYAALAVAIANTLSARRGLTRGAFVGAVALATLYGVAVELVQAPVPWRSLAVGDVAVNTVGGIVGVAAFWVWRRWRRRRTEGSGANP